MHPPFPERGPIYRDFVYPPQLLKWCETLKTWIHDAGATNKTTLEMNYSDLTNVVTLLNAEIREHTGREDLPMEIVETPFSSPYVKFLGIYLWDADNDAREFRHAGCEDEELEPLDEFLRREARKKLDLYAGLWVSPPVPAGELTPTSVVEMLEVLQCHRARERCSSDKTRSVFRRHWVDYGKALDWPRPVTKETFDAAMAKFQ